MRKIILIGILGLALGGCASNQVKEHSVLVGSMGDISIGDMRSSVTNG